MDMSKLPRMSQTPAPPPDAADPNAAPVLVAPRADYGVEPTGSLAEAWISIAIGVILMFVSTAGRFMEYLTSSNFSWTFTDPQGAPLAYRQTVYFWGDVAIFLFAIVLIIEGLLLFTRKPVLIRVALGFTVLTVAMNLIYVAGMMNGGYGFQMWSALAVAFGVYIAMYQWKLLNVMRRGV